MVFMFIVNNPEFIGFIVILTLFLFWKRKNLDIQGSFPFLYILMYKTKLGLGKMASWAKKHPRFFEYLSKISVFVGIFGMIATFIFMFWQLGFIIEQGLGEGGGLVLPIKTVGDGGGVPIFYVPFWYWILALFVLVVVHEFAHGVIAQRQGIKIKSSGFAFLGVLFPFMPAAFVEPDEKDLKKKTWKQQIAVFGAGSMSNFFFGFLFLAMWVFIAGSFVNNTMAIGDISFNSVMNESGLSIYNIGSGEIIALDGVYEKDKIVENLMNLSSNQSINLTINSSGLLNTYEIVTFDNPQKLGKGMVGISGLEFKFVNKQGYEYLGNSPLYFERLLFYFWLLNIGIGIMNLLPIWITDGGQIARTLLLKYFKQARALYIYNIISLISLILIIFTLNPNWLVSLINLF